MALDDTLGFRWNRDSVPRELPRASLERVVFRGILMTEGIDAISIPAIRAAEFNSRMVEFYISRDATEMMAFVLDCHREIVQIRKLNPGLSAIKDVPSIKYFGLEESN
jgi:hypothetical protein